MDKKTVARLKKKSKEIRDKIVEVGYKTQCSHIGSCLSCVEILVYLYYYKMEDEDIFILSKGHAALALYCILNDKGLITDDELENFQEKLGGHVPYKPEKGLLAATGSLGHGVGIALGYAIGNPEINVYTLCGDGEANEGSFWEALHLRDKMKIKNYYVLVDNNELQGFCGTGWGNVPGFEGIDRSVTVGEEQRMKEQPYLADRVRTTKGRGLGRFENKLGSHYWSISKEDYEKYKNKKHDWYWLYGNTIPDVCMCYDCGLSKSIGGPAAAKERNGIEWIDKVGNKLPCVKGLYDGCKDVEFICKAMDFTELEWKLYRDRKLEDASKDIDDRISVLRDIISKVNNERKVS